MYIIQLYENSNITERIIQIISGNYYCRYSDKNHPVKFYSKEYLLKVIG
jgi:hypothetical protein